MSKSLAQRTWDKVAIGAPDECWLWQGAPSSYGYGRIREAGSGSRMLMAHRVVYEMAKGAIPEGMEIDHICRARMCCNPDHLQPVEPRENTRRGLHGELRKACPSGHPATPENTGTSTVTGRNGRPSTARWCRVCKRERGAARRELQEAR